MSVSGMRRIADPHLVGELDDSLQQPIVDRPFDVEAFDRSAGLTGVDEGPPHKTAGGTFEVGVGRHHRGVLAAELELGRNDPLGAATRRRGVRSPPNR